MADFEAKEASEAAPAVAVSAETAPTSPGCFSSLSAPQATRLLHAFTHFLTLALHTLLHQRALYPPETFATVRALNMPIHQSRHPGVCTWVGDAVAAVAAQLRDATVERVCFVVHAPAESRHAVLERWVFDVSSFPAWGSDSSIGNGDNANANASGAADPGTLLIWSDVYEALRGALRRIAYAAESMPPPPDGSTFTLALELRDSAPAPISHPQPWIPSEPDLQPATKSNPERGASLGGISTKPVRAVAAGPLFFECWVEQGEPCRRPNSSSSDPA